MREPDTFSCGKEIKCAYHFDQIGDYVTMLAKFLNMNHAELYENYSNEVPNQMMMAKIFEWHRDGLRRSNLMLQHIDFNFFREIISTLNAGEPFICEIDRLENEVTRSYLQNLNIMLYVCVPIIINDSFWGTIFCSKLVHERNIINEIDDEFNAVFDNMKSYILTNQNNGHTVGFF